MRRKIKSAHRIEQEKAKALMAKRLALDAVLQNDSNVNILDHQLSILDLHRRMSTEKTKAKLQAESDNQGALQKVMNIASDHAQLLQQIITMATVSGIELTHTGLVVGNAAFYRHDLDNMIDRQFDSGNGFGTLDAYIEQAVLCLDLERPINEHCKPMHFKTLLKKLASKAVFDLVASGAADKAIKRRSRDTLVKLHHGKPGYEPFSVPSILASINRFASLIARQYLHDDKLFDSESRLCDTAEAVLLATYQSMDPFLCAAFEPCRSWWCDSINLIYDTTLGDADERLFVEPYGGNYAISKRIKALDTVLAKYAYYADFFEPVMTILCAHSDSVDRADLSAPVVSLRCFVGSRAHPMTPVSQFIKNSVNRGPTTATISTNLSTDASITYNA